MAFMASNWLQGQSVVLFSSKVHLEGSGNNVIVVPLRVATNGRFLPCGSVFCKYTVKNAVPTMAQDKIPWGAWGQVWVTERRVLLSQACLKLAGFRSQYGVGDGKPIHTKKEGSSTKEKWDRQDIWQYDAQRLFVPLYYYMYYYFLFLNMKATGLCSLSLYSVFFVRS